MPLRRAPLEAIAPPRTSRTRAAGRPAGRRPAGGEPAAAAAGATQRIVASITAAIVERRLMPGTKLSEQKIADIFDVSRTLVRQALNQLSRDRLVVLEPARGAFVARPGVDEARQVFEVRRILESALTRRLCASITDAQVAELRRHVDAEQAAVSRSDVAGRTHLLADFHVVLARMDGNRVLTELLSDLLARSSLIALMYQSSHSADESVHEHVAIVDAFERRDADAAVALAVAHLEHVEADLRLAPQPADLSQILRTATA